MFLPFAYLAAFCASGLVLLFLGNPERFMGVKGGLLLRLHEGALFGMQMEILGLLLFYWWFLSWWQKGERNLKTYIRVGCVCSAIGGFYFWILLPLWILAIVISIPATVAFVVTFSWLEARLERSVL